MENKTKAFAYRSLALLAIILILAMGNAFEAGAVSFAVFLTGTALCIGAAGQCVHCAARAEVAERRRVRALRRARAAAPVQKHRTPSAA